MAEKVRIHTANGSFDVDVSGIREVRTNKDGDSPVSYTVIFDGAHADTEHDERAKASARVTSSGNEMTLTREEAAPILTALGMNKRKARAAASDDDGGNDKGGEE